MKPGRELDALIAEKVMGWEWCEYPKDQSWAVAAIAEGKKGYWMVGCTAVNCTNPDGTPNCPAYSTDIAAAWEVVDKIGPIYKGFQFFIYWDVFNSNWRAGWFEWSCGEIDGRFGGESHNVPHAICLAALKTVERKEKINDK